MLTLHHLDYSRSTRVLWLLEELGLSYELVRYRRPVGAKAPVELSAVHPLGKSPVLVDDGFVLAESSAILRYVDKQYGQARFTPKDPKAHASHDEWLDYVEGSLAMPLFVPMMAGEELPESLRKSFASQLAAAWDHVGAVVGDRNFLMGDELTLADIQMSYVVAVASATGALEFQPRIRAYLERMLVRPALVRAIEAGGPMA